MTSPHAPTTEYFMLPLPQNENTSPSRPHVRRHRARMILASLVFAGVILGAIEGAFRLAGYGGYPPTFTTGGTLESGESVVFTDFAGPASYFFTQRSSAGSLDRDAFVMPKPERTLRVMIIGESAAKGIPQPRPLAWSSFLREMLADLAPDRTIEVINLGVTAIASYPALGICTEALRYDPDLIVTWVGNNEFYGAYGVASLHSAGRSPPMIRFIRAVRSLAVAQWVDRHMTARVSKPPTSLMEAMIGRSYIAPDDPARADAARNLSVFTADMIRRCRDRGVPIIVCIPPANERDMAPLGAPNLDAPDPEQRARVDSMLAAARAALRSNPQSAEAITREALTLAPDHAGLHHLLGSALLAQERAPEATESFARAIDLDPMPWRPTTATFDAIRSAAESLRAPICDLRGAFRDASPGGSIGWELMSDHVHPSLAGQELAARAVVKTIAGTPLASDIAMGSPDALPDAAAYARRLGVNDYDAYAVDFSMRLLAQIPFFRESNPGFFARTDASCRRLEATFPEPMVQELRAWAEQPTLDGERRPASGFAARAFVTMGRLGDAAPLFRAARQSVTPYGSWELEYTYLELACTGTLGPREREIALRAVDHGRFLLAHNDSTSGAAERYLGGILQVLGRNEEAIPLLRIAREKLAGPGRLSSDMALVDAYLAVGDGAHARAILEEGVALAGPDAAAYGKRLERLGSR